ncbi:MAG: helix-turn-helix transcriptional regulator, partial [Candidatus Hodarchaeota archaeon]
LVNCPINDEDIGCSVKKMAEELNLSITAVRSYIMDLEKNSLIIKKEQKRGSGRPTRFYSLHDNALALFPKSYSEFSLVLLNKIISLYGEAAAQEILEEIGKEKAKEIQKRIETDFEISFDKISFEEKLKLVTDVFQDKLKFPLLVEEPENFLLKNYNCTIYDIVQNEPMACIVDETCLKELIGSNVEKINCLSEGDHYCVYRISKGENPSSG